MATEAPVQPTAIHKQPPSAILTSKLDKTTTNEGAPVPRGPVDTTLMFYGPPPDGSAPHNYVEDPPPGQPKFNFELVDTPVTLHDARGREAAFTLDGNAFALLPGPFESAEDAFADDEHIERLYYPEVERLLLAHVAGARRVVLFDHTVRRAAAGAARAPVTRVHIDQTPRSAEERVRRHCPADADAGALLAARCRIVNVWRPLNGPVVSHPLAVADSASVRDEDLVPVEHRYPDRTGETAAVRHRADQRWYYWSGMTNQERLLLKCFDSDEEVGRKGRVPHTAFVDPRTPEGSPGRESIEVRALVFG